MASCSSSASSSASFVSPSDGLVPYEEQAVRAWLEKEGVKDGDLRSLIFGGGPHTHPLGRACVKGELNVCKWLFANGAADDITRVGSLYDSTPMHMACWKGHLSVCKWLFEVGAAADITRANNFTGSTPMSKACQEGQLLVCKWLFEVGATADITKADNRGYTPMWIACREGHLPVCKWLFEVGAAADITKANNDGRTPMHIACHGGHLSVCKWLFEVGAAEDISQADKYGITPMYLACKRGDVSMCEWFFEVGAAADMTKANNNGSTPMWIACFIGHLSVCKWLVFNGALNRCHPTRRPQQRGGRIIGRAAPADGSDNGHVDQATVVCDVLDNKPFLDHFPLKLFAWAQDVAATHYTFLHVVLRASVILPNSHHQTSPDERCHLPRLPRVVLERLGDMLGVEMGRRVRNVREFAEALAVWSEERPVGPPMARRESSQVCTLTIHKKAARGTR
jgi:ankyrin repeat protein